MSSRPNLSHKAMLDQFIRNLEVELRQKIDPTRELSGWKLFQRAYINKDIGFSSYFVITMSGAYYSSPKIIDNIRSPI